MAFLALLESPLPGIESVSVPARNAARSSDSDDHRGGSHSPDQCGDNAGADITVCETGEGQ